ncbi:hypothetical protein F5Y10DRAFT_188932 [Nemania abortiva]|nr:hypothetical protein F5Y10DRAFT_188932 [Nemania abortiva]
MSSTVSGSDSDEDPVDITPSPFASSSDFNIDIESHPAYITWRTSAGEEKRLSPLKLDLRYDVMTRKAFFRLRAGVAFKSHPKSRTTGVFLFVHPERIRALRLDYLPQTADAEELGPQTVCLHFNMSRLPALVVPKGSLTPRNLVSGGLMDSLRDVVQQTAFSVYTNISAGILPRRRLLEFCGAVSRNEISSMVMQSDASRLYDGTGANVIEGDSLSPPDSTAATVGHESATEPPVGSPPSYGNVPPGPPPAMPGPHKRQRSNTPEPEHESLQPSDRKCIDICSRMINQLRHDMIDHFEKNLKELELRIIDYVDAQDTKREDDIRDEFCCHSDEEFGGLKSELEFYVQEEMREAVGEVIGETESKVLNHLSEASFLMRIEPS